MKRIKRSPIQDRLALDVLLIVLVMAIAGVIGNPVLVLAAAVPSAIYLLWRIRESGRWYAQLLNAVPDAILVLDGDRTRLCVNKAAETTFGKEGLPEVCEKLLDEKGEAAQRLVFNGKPFSVKREAMFREEQGLGQVILLRDIAAQESATQSNLALCNAYDRYSKEILAQASRFTTYARDFDEANEQMFANIGRIVELLEEAAEICGTAMVHAMLEQTEQAARDTLRRQKCMEDMAQVAENLRVLNGSLPAER